MKNLFKKLKEVTKNKNNLNKRIENELSMKSQIIYTLQSFTLALLLLLAPIIMIIQLIIIKKFIISMIGIFIVFGLFIFLFHLFYYTLVKDKHEKINNLNYKLLIIYNTTFYSVILFIMLSLILIFS